MRRGPRRCRRIAMTLSCDDLRLNEDPIAARAMPTPADGRSKPIGPVQLQATGNVRIDGQVPKQGEFSVQADRASYEQAKDAFVLEGSTRTPAKLWRRGQPGDSPPTEARRFATCDRRGNRSRRHSIL